MQVGSCRSPLYTLAPVSVLLGLYVSACHGGPRHHLVDEADLEGFLALDAAARVEHQRGLGRADKHRQRRGQAEARMEAKAGEVGREARLGGRQPVVGSSHPEQAGIDLAVATPLGKMVGYISTTAGKVSGP